MLEKHHFSLSECNILGQRTNFCMIYWDIKYITFDNTFGFVLK